MGYSDYYCRVLLYSNVSFWFHFYCFVDSVVFVLHRNKLFTSQKQVYIGPIDFLLSCGYLQCEVRLMQDLLYCIWKGFEAIVMFQGYSDSLVVLFDRFASYQSGNSVNKIAYQLLKINCYVSGT